MSTLSVVRPGPSAIPTPPGARRLVPLLAVASGLAVADNYYLQPLLALIGADLGASSVAVGAVAALALLGYALGLLLVVPLGDIVDRRPLVAGTLGLTTLALAAMTAAPSVPVLAVAAFGIGLTSVVAQVLVPYAASLADDLSRGRVVGAMMSGILTGIVGARVAAALVGAELGWRAVYAGATGLTAALLVVLLRRLPAETSRHRRNGRADVPYREVLAGVGRLARSSSTLRWRSFYGFCGFGVFSAVWTTLAFHLRDQYGLGTGWLAAIALLGIAGAVLSPRAGRLADRGHTAAVTAAAYALLLVGTLLLAVGGTSMAALLVGLVAVDLAIQAGHVANLGVVYALAPHARSRVTTVYMTTVFAGGAVGSLSAATTYGAMGWGGVAAFCALLALAALVGCATQLPVLAPRALDEPYPEAVA